MLESEPDFPHVHYTIRPIKSLEDIGPAMIERGQQEGLIYDEHWSWLFDDKRSTKIKQYLPKLFAQIHDKIFINYLNLAHTAVTGEARAKYDDWNWAAVTHKTLVKGFLQQHIANYSEGEGQDRAKSALEILERLAHQDGYSVAELNTITNPQHFMSAAQTAMPEALECVEQWALSGHVGAYQLLMSCVTESPVHADLLLKWQDIMDKTPDYPIEFADQSFNNQGDLVAWLRTSQNKTLIDAYASLRPSQWLTITQLMSERAADGLAAKCRACQISTSA